MAFQIDADSIAPALTPAIDKPSYKLNSPSNFYHFENRLTPIRESWKKNPKIGN